VVVNVVYVCIVDGYIIFVLWMVIYFIFDIVVDSIVYI